MSPTQRTLKWLRKDGYTAAITERWNPHAKIRQDLFGFVDVVAIKPDATGVLAVQATSGSNTSARLEKIRGIAAARVWLESGNRLQVVGWRQLVARNKDGTKAKVKRWEPKVVEVTLSDLPSSKEGEPRETATPGA